MRIDDFPKRNWPERPKSDDSPEVSTDKGETLPSVEAALTVLNAYVSGRPVPAIRVIGVESEAGTAR